VSNMVSLPQSCCIHTDEVELFVVKYITKVLPRLALRMQQWHCIKQGPVRLNISHSFKSLCCIEEATMTLYEDTL
jgi:hypothetical protein